MERTSMRAARSLPRGMRTMEPRSMAEALIHLVGGHRGLGVAVVHFELRGRHLRVVLLVGEAHGPLPSCRHQILGASESLRPAAVSQVSVYQPPPTLRVSSRFSSRKTSRFSTGFFSG